MDIADEASSFIFGSLRRRAKSAIARASRPPKRVAWPSAAELRPTARARRRLHQREARSLLAARTALWASSESPELHRPQLVSSAPAPRRAGVAAAAAGVRCAAESTALQHRRRRTAEIVLFAAGLCKLEIDLVAARPMARRPWN